MSNKLVFFIVFVVIGIAVFLRVTESPRDGATSTTDNIEEYRRDHQPAPLQLCSNESLRQAVDQNKRPLPYTTRIWVCAHADWHTRTIYTIQMRSAGKRQKLIGALYDDGNTITRTGDISEIAIFRNQNQKDLEKFSYNQRMQDYFITSSQEIDPAIILKRIEDLRHGKEDTILIANYSLLGENTIDETHKELYVFGLFEEFEDSERWIIKGGWALWPYVLWVKKEDNTWKYDYNISPQEWASQKGQLKALFPPSILSKYYPWKFEMYITTPAYVRAEEELWKKVYVPYSGQRNTIYGKRCETDINKYVDQQVFKRSDQNCFWENWIDYTLIFGKNWTFQDFLVGARNTASWKFSGSTWTVLVEERDNNWVVRSQRRITIIDYSSGQLTLVYDIL